MKTRLILLASAAMLGAFGIAAMRAEHPGVAALAATEPVVAQQEQSPIIGYRRWVRVNATPHEVSSEVALLCREPTAKELANDAANPHLDPSYRHSPLRTRFVTVYVNQTAARAMLHQKQPRFPVGSIIVKERLATPTSSLPELITVMQKQNKGYNPACGDWEFLVLDGSGTQVHAHGALKYCQSCHEDWNKTDYVSRAYLSDNTRLALR